MNSPAISTRFLSLALRATTFVNLAGGLTALLLPDLFARLLYGRPLPAEPYIWRYHICLWGFVVAMGLAYALAARDPEHEHSILLSGGLGKTLVACVFTEMLLTGLGTWMLASAIAWDGTLGILFLVALWQRRKQL